MTEIKIKWTNFKKIFDNNPVLIFQTKDSLLNNLQKINNQRDEEEQDDEDEELDLNQEQIEELLDLQGQKLESGTSNFNTAFNELHNFQWFDLETEKSENLNENYMLIKANSFNKYKLAAIDFYLQKYKINNNKVKYVSIKNSLDDRISLTKEWLADENIDVIINPCFRVETEYNKEQLVFELNNSIYDKKTQKIVDVSYKSVTNLENNIKCLYTYLCLNYLKHDFSMKFQDYSVLIIDPFAKNEKNFKKNQIWFYEAFGSLCKENKLTIKTNNKTLSVHKLLSDSGLYAFFETGKYNSNSKFSFFNCVKFKHCLEWKNKNPKIEGTYDFDNLLTTYDFLERYGQNLSGLDIPPFEVLDFFSSFEYFLEFLIKSYKEFGEIEKLNINALKYFAFSAGNVSQGQDKKDKISIIDLKIKKWFDFPKIDYHQEIQMQKHNIDSKIGGILLPKYIVSDPELKTLILNALIGFDYEKFSGKYYKVKDIVSKEFVDKKASAFNKMDDYFNINIANLIRKLHIKDARICWYDYEGFSELFPIIDHLNPYNQLVNQVSVIITKNGKEESVQNIVKDTKNLKLQDLCEMIEVIYANKADYFVVFNKAYENTRNKEILEFVKKAHQDAVLENIDPEVKERANNFISWFNTKYSNLNEFINIINHINDNTIDLADCFAFANLAKNDKYAFFNSLELKDYYVFEANEKTGTINLIDKDPMKFISKNQPTFQKTTISIKFLKYYFSIKKIEKYITYNHIKLKNMIKPYSELKEVQKGTDAMEKAIQRYLGAIGDNLWENLFVPNLKIYCENDVRAMMMVYDFLMLLITKAKPEITDFEYQLEDPNLYYKFEGDKIVLGK
ncbi:UU173 family protein [Mycoplasmopsis gallopavonis]|uniref:Domain of uncharacterized function(DUF2779) n=1 Tax=Mycoplasmopsis gallopavonis TaxID=76629 RepID=A0A449AYM8_9BACT|nr:DUF2779 domain-containing protein [Mycoplasmopsis gallopavonis]RIV16611.1 DUF2779 domain-containing protein [Mycoplasmopsis gallopavonis]VEU72611.1 Domain of uncharacterised function(DUF2779) [Mycoplasmopsis gallopavonis]